MGVERFIKRIRPLIRRRPASAAENSPRAAKAQLPPALEGPFSHENYPAEEIAAFLETCRALTQQRMPSKPVQTLRREMEDLAAAHQILAAKMVEFNAQASELRQEILALTAAARPLQEPGIAAVDAKALRASLAERAKNLRQRRSAYETQAAALEARIQEEISQINDLRDRIQAALGLNEDRE